MWKFASNEPAGSSIKQERPVNGERHQNNCEKRNRPRVVAVVTVVTWDGAHSLRSYRARPYLAANSLDSEIRARVYFFLRVFP